MGQLIYLVPDPQEIHTPGRREKLCEYSVNSCSPGSSKALREAGRNPGKEQMPWHETVTQGFNTPPATIIDSIDAAEEAVDYYKAHAALFFIGGFLMYGMAGVSTFWWGHLWSGIAFIFMGGASWIMFAVCSKNVEWKRHLLRHFSKMGYQTTED